MATSKYTRITVGGHHCQWEWEGDKSSWQQYPTTIQEQISKAFDSGKDEIDVDLSDQLQMTIDFDGMTQTNRKTKCLRRIRLSIFSEDSTGFYVYQWQDEHKNWQNYNVKTMIEIFKALGKGESQIKINCESRSYSIDLDKLIQTNTTTKVKRKIQRIKSMAKIPGEQSKSVKRSAEETAEETAEPKSNKKRAVSNRSESSSSSSKKLDDLSVRTVTTIAGRTPVDQECTTLIGKVNVYAENKDVFNCTLNQTNVGNNNNKFYLIQILEENNKKNFYVWLRWGRVGYRGQTSLQDFGNQLDDAKRFFCQKFREKSGNEFYHRDTFTKIPGKYDFVEIDYNPEETKKVKEEKSEKEISRPIVVSKLDQRVQDLVSLICNVRAMEEALIEMKFDAKKNPLGKLSSAQIKAGYSALKEIEQFIKARNFGQAFVEANNNFYTRIPHECGRQAPPLIKTEAQLKLSIKLLETLDDIEVGFKCLKKENDDERNPIDQHYENLQCQMRPIEPEEEIYQLIDRYLQTTHAATHQQYKMEIEQIFEIDRQNEKSTFNDLGNKMLLWHGSRLTNFAGILSQGLRIAPPEAPVTGYMFGKGIYFADMSSKSANYCYPTKSKSTGLVLLSEVSLGKCNELVQADINADKLPSGCSSVKGLGSIGPKPSNSIKIDGEITVPIGPAESLASAGKNLTLNYNEFIVYDTKQVRLRYLLKIKFLFK